MECPFCEHPKAHKHSKTSKGHQRYRCPSCQQTFADTLDTLYYRRQLSAAEIEGILQAYRVFFRPIQKASVSEALLGCLNARTTRLSMWSGRQVRKLN